MSLKNITIKDSPSITREMAQEPLFYKMGQDTKASGSRDRRTEEANISIKKPVFTMRDNGLMVKETVMVICNFKTEASTKELFLTTI